MQVVANEPQAWLLLNEDKIYLLDINCNHGAFGYSVMIQLSPSELKIYQRLGNQFISNLAQSVQNAGPGSELQLRDVSSEYSEMSLKAIYQWRSEHQLNL